MDEGNNKPRVLALAPLLSFSLPAFVSSAVALLCVVNTWMGPGRSQVTGSREPHLSSLVLTTMAVVSLVLTFHLQRWMEAIVGFKERAVGREESEDGFLYLIFHFMGWQFRLN